MMLRKVNYSECNIAESEMIKKRPPDDGRWPFGRFAIESQ